MLNIQHLQIVPAAEPKSYSGAALADKYVSMKNSKHITILIQTGAWAAGTAAVSLKQATKVDGAGGKPLGFVRMWAQQADGTWLETAVAANTFNLAAANKAFVIEVDSAELDVNGGFDCITLAVASPGANADFYAASYLMTCSRYMQSPMPTPVAD
jgi:hypothetical protein